MVLIEGDPFAWLETRPTYESQYAVVSHVWANVSEVLVAGISKPLLINANKRKLEWIQSLAQDTTGLPVWIDVYSIDQNDISDKSAQVQIMGDIYKNSTVCFVYLEENEKVTEELKGIIQKINELIENPQFIMDSIELFLSFTIALKSCCRRQRVWTFQEEQFANCLVYVLDCPNTLEGRVIFDIRTIRTSLTSYFGRLKPSEVNKIISSMASKGLDKRMVSELTIGNDGSLMETLANGAFQDLDDNSMEFSWTSSNFKIFPDLKSTYPLLYTAGKYEVVDRSQEAPRLLQMISNRRCSVLADHVYGYCAVLSIKVTSHYGMSACDIFQEWFLKLACKLIMNVGLMPRKLSLVSKNKDLQTWLPSAARGVLHYLKKAGIGSRVLKDSNSEKSEAKEIANLLARCYLRTCNSAIAAYGSQIFASQWVGSFDLNTYVDLFYNEEWSRITLSGTVLSNTKTGSKLDLNDHIEIEDGNLVWKEN
ncbi:hypothetical protein HK096_005693, partial [Nowakowskiella sp. JEL0078]